MRWFALALLLGCPSSAEQSAPAPVTPHVVAAPVEVDAPPMPQRVGAVLADSRWELRCVGYACEIRWFELHADGSVTYHYHDGRVFHDRSTWRLDGDRVTIEINDAYAVYTARYTGQQLVEGEMHNRANLRFTWSALPLAEGFAHDPQ